MHKHDKGRRHPSRKKNTPIYAMQKTDKASSLTGRSMAQQPNGTSTCYREPEGRTARSKPLPQMMFPYTHNMKIACPLKKSTIKANKKQTDLQEV